MKTMKKACMTGLLLVFNPLSAALADPPAAEAPRPPAPPELTMRIIENPDAVSPEAITRRIELPPLPAQAPAAARDRGPEPGEAAADKARELAERAAEQREEFGRSRAEEMRPEPPQPPTPPRPPRP
jgi:hypothetical protein